MSDVLFHEVQAFRQPRLRWLLAVLPAFLTVLAVVQVGLGYHLSAHQTSNGGLVFLTLLLWAVYLWLLRVRLVTDVRRDEVSIALRGLLRRRRIAMAVVKSARAVSFDPIRDFGGYGIRPLAGGTAYIAGGTSGVRLDLQDGGVVIIGSERTADLVSVCRKVVLSH